MTGVLALEDGTIVRGESVAADGFAVGEAVFTTAMTGSQEIVRGRGVTSPRRLGTRKHEKGKQTHE